MALDFEVDKQTTGERESMDFYKSKGLSRTLLGLSCFLLSSCAMNETDYEPKLKAPSEYGQMVGGAPSHASLDPNAAIDKDFYRVYKDENLNALMQRALSYNYDLRTAYFNLKQAKISLGLAETAFSPTVNAGMNAGVSKDLSSGAASTKNSGANFSVSYEADLMGKLSAQERSSFESFRASAYDFQAMRLMIIQTCAEYYWQYAYAKEALSTAHEQLIDSQKRLDLIKSMLQYGAADSLEYDQALVNHRMVEQTVYQREYELNSAHYALTYLLGLTPNESVDNLINPKALIESRCPVVKLELPASLLQNRPDLRAYEARLRAAIADVDLAKANFYPSFNLSAGLSTGSGNTLGRFLTDPIGTLGAAITLPFFNYNELSLQEESSLIASDQAKLNFANGFINAIKEVSDAMSNLRYQERMIRSTYNEFTLTKRNYARFVERYREGLSSLSDMLDASDELRSAQMKLLGAKRDLMNASMSLMVALGGDAYDADASVVLEQANQSIAPEDRINAIDF